MFLIQRIPGESKKMYLSLIKHKLKAALLIFKALTSLNQNFYFSSFDILLFIFRFIFVQLPPWLQIRFHMIN